MGGAGEAWGPEGDEAGAWEPGGRDADDAWGPGVDGGAWGLGVDGGAGFAREQGGAVEAEGAGGVAAWEVLVAHPEPGPARLAAAALEAAGMRARLAHSATAALRAVAARPPDLLLLAPALPPHRGSPLLALLAAHPLRARMAILALDAHEPPDGADDALPPLASPQALRARAAALLRARAAERAARSLLLAHADAQHALRAAARRLAACPSTQAAAAAAADLARAFGLDRAALALYDPHARSLRLAAHAGPGPARPAPHGHPAAPLALLRDLPAHRLLFGEGRPWLHLPPAPHAPPYFRPYLDGPPHEALLLALRGPDGPLGLLVADNLPSRRPLTPQHAQALAALAALAAPALLRTRRAEALATRAAHAQALAQAAAALADARHPAAALPGALAALAHLLPAQHAALLRYEEGWAIAEASWGEPPLPSGTRLFPIGGPQRHWAPSEGERPHYLPDTTLAIEWRDVGPWVGERQLRSVVAVPMLSGETLVGSLIVASLEPHAYTEEQLEVVAMFAERIDMALRKARLREAERERLRAAEELVQMRNDFVASVSHELRTPLTAILGFTEILQERWGEIDERTRLEWIEKIAHAAGRQRKLVEDLLLMTRVERGDLSFARGPISLQLLARRAAEEIQGIYKDQRIDLVGLDDVVVMVDRDRALQIIAILADNAAKYSPEGSPIIMWWGVEDDLATLRVLDRGAGIPAQGWGILFSRFGRLAQSPIREGRVGTGLGLYLGRSMAEAMGGTLELETTGPEGSTFRLALPLAPGTRAEPTTADGQSHLATPQADERSPEPGLARSVASMQATKALTERGDDHLVGNLPAGVAR